MRQFLLKQRTPMVFDYTPARKNTIKISDQECLMLLRAYQVNPCSWERILESIQENSHTLPSDAKVLYSSATKKQLKDRLSTKRGKIFQTPADKIANLLIRYNFQ